MTWRINLKRQRRRLGGDPGSTPGGASVAPRAVDQVSERMRAAQTLGDRPTSPKYPGAQYMVFTDTPFAQLALWVKMPQATTISLEEKAS